jgi:ubiquinone biosynthesis monooxygenase Coq7
MIEKSRRFTFADQLISALDEAVKTLGAAPRPAGRPATVGDAIRGELSASEREDVEGVMRINHTGEVCAQALYKGQALTARSESTRAQLLEAAEEELDHLNWCEQMLDELNGRPSYLNPVWYAGSFVMGAAAGLAGDSWSLGFLVETERQVEAHLDEHLERMPEADPRSRAVLEQMKVEEAAHADHALQAGGKPLPQTIQTVMGLTADFMKAVTYRV